MRSARHTNVVGLEIVTECKGARCSKRLFGAVFEREQTVGEAGKPCAFGIMETVPMNGIAAIPVTSRFV
jgi:hypothetical protein